MLKRGALTLIVLLTATPALAGSRDRGATWDDRYWIRQAVRSSCEWWENCQHKYRYRYVRREVDRRYDDRVLSRCKPAIRVWGQQAQTTGNAEGHARVALSGAIRFSYGEIYLNQDYWEDVKVLCGPTSVPDTVTSKTVLPDYFRCEVEAKPCRPRRKED